MVPLPVLCSDRTDPWHWPADSSCFCLSLCQRAWWQTKDVSSLSFMTPTPNRSEPYSEPRLLYPDLSSWAVILSRDRHLCCGEAGANYESGTSFGWHSLNPSAACVPCTDLPGMVALLDPGPSFMGRGWSAWKMTVTPGASAHPLAPANDPEEKWLCLYSSLDGCLLLWHLPFQMCLHKAEVGSWCLLETGTWNLCPQAFSQPQLWAFTMGLEHAQFLPAQVVGT